MIPFLPTFLGSALTAFGRNVVVPAWILKTGVPLAGCLGYFGPMSFWTRS